MASNPSTRRKTTIAAIVTSTIAEQAVTTTRNRPSPPALRVAHLLGWATPPPAPTCALIGRPFAGWRRRSLGDRLTVQRHLLELVDALLLQILAERLVVDARGHVLAGGEHPREEVDQRRRLARAGLILIDQRPGGPGDRVRLRVTCVGQVEAEIGGVGDSVGGSQDGLVARLDEGADLVLHVGVAEMLRERVAKLDVADGPLGLSDSAGHTLVALAADAVGPGNGLAAALGGSAESGHPAGTLLREKVSEDVGGARAIRAMHGGDRQAG